MGLSTVKTILIEVIVNFFTLWANRLPGSGENLHRQEQYSS